MIELAAWQDSELPFTVEYARPALERIRQRAAEGLIALPRVGMGVGGLLLGERTPAGISIAGAVELPCSHSLGPTFHLTPDEIRQSLELVKSAAAQRSVVGIYCTRTRGALALSATDRELFDALCPEPWQIVLALRPAPGEPTRAAVCFRQAGEMVQGAIRELWEWRPVELDESQVDSSAVPEATAPVAPPTTAPPVVTPQTKPLPAPPVIPMVIPMPAPAASAASAAAGGAAAPTLIEMPMPRPLPPAAPPKAPLSEPVARPVPPFIEALEALALPVPPRRPAVNPKFAADPVREPRPVPMSAGSTMFAFAQPPVTPPNKTPLRLLLLAAGLVFVAVGGGMFATRDAWMPRPPLTLNCTDTNGMLEIRWNAAAARGLDHGLLLINDGGGGQLDTVTLDPLTLLSGSFLYKRKSDRVTVTLDLGNERARTAFPPDSDATGTSAVPQPASTTLPTPPQSGSISAFGNPPQTNEPAPAAIPPDGTPGALPSAPAPITTAPAQDTNSARPLPPSRTRRVPSPAR